MLNKKQLFALLLVGSLSSGMYAMGGASASSSSSSGSGSSSKVPTPAPNPDGFIPRWSKNIHSGFETANKWTGDWLGGAVKDRVKTKFAVYALIAWMGYESSDRIRDKLTQALEAAKRT